MTSPKVVKIKSKFKKKPFSYRIKNVLSYLSIPFSMLDYYFHSSKNKNRLHQPFKPNKLDPFFFGINTAPNPTKEMDDYFIEHLKDLGVKAVRTDYHYNSDPKSIERWIERLIKEDFEVMIHFVQPTSAASTMDDPSTNKKWSKFVEGIISKYHKHIKLYEIGSTPNRQTWSAYTIKDYLIAVKTAKKIADKYQVKIIGPNISDFAPYFQITILRKLAQFGIVFDMVSDNLFVDRGGQPEEFDKHVGGDILKNIFKMNLLKKSKVISNIAAVYGCDYPICTYTYWTLDAAGRKRRRYVSEDKYADYLVRYHVLTAASGYLKRIYWGTIASFHKGLIDEIVRFRSYPPLVYFKQTNYGEPSQYRLRPGYYTYKFLINTLDGSSFVKTIASNNTTFIYEFERNGKSIYSAWTLDEKTDPLSNHLQLKPSEWNIFDKAGNKIEFNDSFKITEHPVYIIQK